MTGPEHLEIVQSGDGLWATFREAEDGTLTRLRSPRLRWRSSRIEAEHDLLLYVGERYAAASSADRERWRPLYDALLRRWTGRGLP